MPPDPSLQVPRSPSPHPRIGVDTGGTFTDLVLLDATGVIVATHKLLSTPDDPARAVLRGIDELLAKAGHPPRHERPTDVVHGSTVATNALLEHADARVVFVTTAGFEDTLRLARQHRPDLYDLHPRRPDPPVPPERCVGVRERMRHDGSIITPLSADEIERIVAELSRLDPQAVAVSLLHSYANDTHERRLGEAIAARLSGVHLTLSCDLLPVFREYERAAACVVSAVVAPRMTRYLGRLASELGGDRLRIMGSHGGTLSPAEAMREPIQTILSGPAGGVRGAAALGERLITFDMGGTSTDVALIEAEPTLAREHTVGGEAGGLPVMLPMIDLHTVGAGGGSIAWLDAGGALRVGPRSAGADPGPACYGRQSPSDAGGWKPTVTDAHVTLGHLAPDATLGEGLRIDAAAARAALQQLADAAGLDVQRAAEGVLRVAEATMMRAVHRISLQRGHDPRGFTLVPFGGAGGLHACRLAELLGIDRVLVPPNPGLLSAVGMLTAPPRRIATRSLHRTVAPGEPLPDLSPLFVELIERLDAGDWPNVTYQREVEMRYAGQSFEITLDTDREDGELLDAFAAEHARLYGYRDDDRPVELVNLRCHAIGAAPTSTPANADAPAAPTPDAAHAPLARSRAPGDGPLPRIPRGTLRPGDRGDGPCIITEYSATTVVPQGWSFAARSDATLELTRDAAAKCVSRNIQSQSETL